MKLFALLTATAAVAWPGPALDGIPAVGPAASVASGSDDFTWHGRLRAGQTLEIKGVNGGIRAELASGDEAEVVATKRAQHDDPEEVKIEVVEHAGGVTICAVYPPGRRGRENRCAPGNEGRVSSENNDVNVMFVVKVPAGVNYHASTINGDLRAGGLRSNVEAATVNGDIRVATVGRAEATTVNGSIDAAMGRADWPDGASFTTVNGSITLQLPADVNADVSAETVNGDIETDFALTVRGRFGPRHMRGTIGRGGPTLELETVNGSIELRRTP